MDQAKVFGLLMIAFLFVASYSYVVGEAEDISTADPTHNGKEFLADYLPFFWVIIILAVVGVTLEEVIDF